MDKNSILAFEEAARQVFREIGFSDMETFELEAKANGTSEVVATVGITGRLLGYLSISGSLSTASNCIRQMFQHLGMEEEESGFGQVHREALGELVNQICGRSSMLLEEMSIEIDITPPTILIGSDIFFDIDKLEDLLHKKIVGEFGTFNLFVGIRSYS